jgi:hypothetical protein
MAVRKVFGLAALSSVIVLCVAAVAGCGKGKSQEKIAETMIEQAIKRSGGGDADVDLRGGTVRIRSEDGQSEMSIAENGWPKDLPGDVPEFKRAKVKGVSRSERQGRKGWTVVLTDIDDEAYAKYADELEVRGWTIASNMTTGEGGMFQASKDEWVVFGVYNQDAAEGTIRVSMQ